MGFARGLYVKHVALVYNEYSCIEALFFNTLGGEQNDHHFVDMLKGMHYFEWKVLYFDF